MRGDLPSLRAPSRVAGRGRGWGVYRLSPLAASLLKHPPPPTPPHRFAGGRGGDVRNGGLFANRNSAVIARLDRSTQYSRDADGKTEKPRRTGSPGHRRAEATPSLGTPCRATTGLLL